MAWHGGDPRATIEALLLDRVRLQGQLAIARLHGKGLYPWMDAGAEFER